MTPTNMVVNIIFNYELPFSEYFFTSVLVANAVSKPVLIIGFV